MHFSFILDLKSLKSLKSLQKVKGRAIQKTMGEFLGFSFFVFCFEFLVDTKNTKEKFENKKRKNIELNLRVFWFRVFSVKEEAIQKSHGVLSFSF